MEGGAGTRRQADAKSVVSPVPLWCVYFVVVCVCRLLPQHVNGDGSTEYRLYRSKYLCWCVLWCRARAQKVFCATERSAKATERKRKEYS